ncbi:Crp/Fnr family transcriptional regulator [Psychroflexus planctonicus]|uniref:Crp/Fnr family transcriptional regulator n=1 Tax=Psychroflexus planctonicus TaxID=1526575 RepID=A0ABQ1SGK3_9FLAO|nr:Crp/Fnr family transcriptional regulator [Psychroflexus planctonicus]GGE29679.1 Crp/Fnr family transcriptional regulator [Psychroflexus planctonicus]
MRNIIEANYGHLFEKELITEIIEVGTLKDVPKGSEMMQIGQYIKSMPLLLDGAVKIMREDEDGFELLLYYIEKGETCSMTLNCCLNQKRSEIKAVAEKDTELVMIPIQKMEEWMAKYRSWRNFVLDSYNERMNELLDVIDVIAFKKMDERLLDYLKNKLKFTEDKIIKSTHQDIAYDLHTSRVVISRLLKTLEKKGNIILHRNSVEVVNID